MCTVFSPDVNASVGSATSTRGSGNVGFCAAFGSFRSTSPSGLSFVSLHPIPRVLPRLAMGDWFHVERSSYSDPWRFLVFHTARELLAALHGICESGSADGLSVTQSRPAPSGLVPLFGCRAGLARGSLHRPHPSLPFRWPRLTASSVHLRDDLHGVAPPWGGAPRGFFGWPSNSVAAAFDPRGEHCVSKCCLTAHGKSQRLPLVMAGNSCSLANPACQHWIPIFLRGWRYGHLRPRSMCTPVRRITASVLIRLTGEETLFEATFSRR